MNAIIKSEAAPNTIPAYTQLTETMAACKQLGASLKTTFNLVSPAHGEIMFLTCLSEQISVSDYHKRYHPDGSMRASQVQAVFMSRGGVINWNDLGDDGKVASAKFSHPKLMKTARLITYTIEDAKRQVGDKISKAGSNWATNPGAMLRAALIRKAVKIIDPGVVTGYDDFNDMDPDPVSRASVVVVDAEAAAARKQELLDGMTADAGDSVVVADEEIIDAVVEQKTEEPPFDASAENTTEADVVETVAVEAAEEPVVDPNAVPLCTEEQLSELATLGQQLPSPDRSGQKMDLNEVLAGIREAAEVVDYTQMTESQADSLIERFRGELSKLP
jgi:hypothetical protein